MSASNPLSLKGTVVNLRTVDTKLPVLTEFVQAYQKDREIVDAFASGGNTEITMGSGSAKELAQISQIPAHKVHEDLILGVHTKDSDQLIGIAAFHHTNCVLDRTGLVGIYISDQNIGMGYRSDAMKLLLQHVFTTTQIRKLDAIYIGENDLIRKYLEKSGFKFEATLHQHILGKDKKPLDVGVLSLFKEAFFTV